MNREELLRSARNIYENPGTNEALKVVLEETYPELKESEDERIRTRLIALVEAFGQGKYKNEMLAYLEKQKEQKAAECIEDSVKFEEGFKAGRESGLCDGQKYVLNNLDSYGLCESAEWSEEDEKKIHFLSRLIEFQVKNDEYCFSEGRFVSKQEAIEMLKSLRPQPKPELTLLDENIINAAVAFVEQNDHFNCWRGIDKHTVIKALRSIKPHWKPSEEQIEALENSTALNEEQGAHLYSLLCDLKKQM